MKRQIFLELAVSSMIAAVIFLINSFPAKKLIGLQNENGEKEESYVEDRARYDFDMMKDPVTGKIPPHIFEQQLAFAKNLPVKDYGTTARGQDLNNYIPAGPNNIGGRTRALAYDVRYNGTTNKVIIAGSVSGGIMRSSDGGQTWIRVSPDNEIHNVTSIAQDPRVGFQDTWYAGGGEPLGNSASEIAATYLGFGLYKSINNGVNWIRLPLNTITDIGGGILAAGTLEAFDHPFDFVHKLAINPVNGNVYIAGHRRLIRSTDGGSTYQVVFGSGVAAIATAGQMDIAITTAGKVVLAVNGGAPDLTLRGVWTSATGDLNSYSRIAGGTVAGVDSVSGWRANSYDFFTGSTTYIPKRILIGLAPSNQNIAYVLYENGKSNESPDLVPEADMYKLDMTGGINTWTNLSANMPDFPGGNHAATDPMEVQGGYDLFVAVKPTDPNFVILGGSSLYRSTDGFATANYNTTLSWIGGYGNTLPTLTFYTNSHPDIHNFVFNPVNPNEALCSNDGGIQMTTDINAAGSTVNWTMISNYQTLQYYYVAIDPETVNDFVGGAQDNGTQFRDKNGLIGTIASDSNNHRRILSGDGCAVGFSKINGGSQFVYASFQFGNIRRITANASLSSTDIRPNGLTTSPGSTTEFGEFVTNFKLDPDNTEDLYYVNFNRLFRTISASTVSASGWTELTGVGQAVNPVSPTTGTNIGIRAVAFSRGAYATSHVLYIGATNGKIFRLDNPRNAPALQSPTDITPPALVGGANVQDIAVNPNDDDEILAIVSNYGVTNIWWTNNAKSASPTWRNAEGNLTLPSIRSAVIVVKKDGSNNPVTEYYVGTSVGLYSALNIGTTLIGGGSPTWQREGGSVLNFALIQSMAYRPVDNVLLVGTHGNGIYYTFLGTANFSPNQNTGIDPVTNDKNFIKKVFPTIGSDHINYQVGNLFTVKKISIQLFNMSGQEVLRKEQNYQDGNIDISRLADGAYILSITSDDKKYRQLQKIINQ